MSEGIQFETPENIQVTYEPAGLGTRFVAWLLDNILMLILCFVLFIALACLGIATEGVLRQIAEGLDDAAGEMGPIDQQRAERIVWYFFGIWLLVWGLGSFFYYGLSELLMRGQTMGKRLLSIRVVKADGFSLDPGSVLIRNVFRVLDQLPPLWVVPVVSARSQRFGDMVAATLVVSDKPPQMSPIREALSRRPAAESRFRFDKAKLDRARPQDFDAVERILERWPGLAPAERETLLSQVVEPLARRLQVDVPAGDERLQFLEDFLAAEYRRQYRTLG